MNRGRSGGAPQYRRPDHRRCFFLPGSRPANIGATLAGTRRQEKPESSQQFQERVRRTREEQTAAHERRKREDAARKARAAREKEQGQLLLEPRKSCYS